MTAKELVDQWGEKLIGRSVLTYRYGAWPTSVARVTELHPDPGAPEIVFTVDGSEDSGVQAAIRAGELDGPTIGVFANEEVLPVADAAIT